MEALLPPHVLHGDDDCNQLVAPFNTESETSHTARGSSDSRTGYDGGPLDRAISGPARQRRADPISSAVHRLAGQLVERGVPSRVALVLAHNGVEPKDLASTPIEEALSAARAESITLKPIEERKLRTLCCLLYTSPSPRDLH